MISTPVISSAFPLSYSTRVEAISRRLTCACKPDHVDLVALGGRLARQAAADVLADQLGVLRRHQVRQAPPDELDAIDADEAGELAVGVQDHFAVHQHRLVDAIAEVGKQLRGLERLALGARSRRASAGG